MKKVLKFTTLSIFFIATHAGCNYLLPTLPGRGDSEKSAPVERQRMEHRESMSPNTVNHSYRRRFVNNMQGDNMRGDNSSHKAQESPVNNRGVLENSSMEGKHNEPFKALEKELEQKNKKINELEDALAHSERERQKLLSDYSDYEIRALKAEQKMESLKLEILNREHVISSRFPYFYEVQRGDSLWRIAGRDEIFKNPYKWLELYHANKEKIQDPNMLYPGMMIKIPRIFEFLFVPAIESDHMEHDQDTVFTVTESSGSLNQTNELSGVKNSQHPQPYKTDDFL